LQFLFLPTARVPLIVFAQAARALFAGAALALTALTFAFLPAFAPGALTALFGAGALSAQTARAAGIALTLFVFFLRHKTVPSAIKILTEDPERNENFCRAAGTSPLFERRSSRRFLRFFILTLEKTLLSTALYRKPQAAPAVRTKSGEQT
jgi:hypothetical protein